MVQVEELKDIICKSDIFSQIQNSRAKTNSKGNKTKAVLFLGKTD